jgi:DNA-binding beta-propeller fold protein YncE
MSRSFGVRARLTVLAGLAAAVGLVWTSAASPSAPARAAGCNPRLQLIAHGQGSPDDLVWDGQSLWVSDINGGKVGVVAHGRVRTLAAHIREPEGMVPRPGGSLIVAAQATNSVLKIDLSTGTRTTLARLPLPAGKTGIDGINADGPDAVFVPDSARGRLYVLQLSSRKLSLIGSGMVRPVAAINWDHAIVVADEYGNAVWRIGRERSRLATVPVPDDFTVISHHLIASSLVGGVWEVAPHLRKLASPFPPTTSDPQGLVSDGPNAVIVTEQSHNAIYRLGLAGCL